MKPYNFDEIIERCGTDCFKWDALPAMYGRDDLTPMWVADMDFRSPDFVMEAIRKRCEHEVLGYTMPSKGYWQAVNAWLQKHYNINATKEELHFIPGIVAGIAYTLLCLTEPGEKVLVTTPVYPPFLNLPKESRRELVCRPLNITNGHFSINFEDFERKHLERLTVFREPESLDLRLAEFDGFLTLAIDGGKHNRQIGRAHV